MGNYTPPVGFHFRVEVLGLSPHGNDVRFTEVSGLSVELGTLEVPEGGENRFVQKFPAGNKYSELVLKRGLLTDSGIAEWISRCINDFIIEPKNIDVMLLNENHEPLITWHLVNAYPTRWSVSDFNSTANAIAIESLQFYYQYFTTDKNE